MYEVKLTGGQVFSSTRLINTALSGLPDDVRRYMEDFRQRNSLEEIKRYISAFYNSRRLFTVSQFELNFMR